MICPRLSVSILDEIEDDLSSSLCLSPRRLRDESLSVSWNKPSLRARALLYEIKSKVNECRSHVLLEHPCAVGATSF
ncbi:hypothetical protein HID58_095919 [Brassica napus]|uniref:Uncharacterized protein n=1 Tax=Brassica napus TaxID=3708 RepID=A0ABQ7X1X6_BRANA|nr:hypothetical protein HID58_095919 [Brassica napus]